MIGLGARIRIRPTVYIVGEFTPARLRATGRAAPKGGFAIEKRAGGHQFQLNFGDAFGTTMTQIARGGPDGSNWYLGSTSRAVL
jgi:hypothetical protein